MQENHLRIIGGQWRSRKVSFNDAPGLRPTPNRVRETLYNWIQNRISGSHCLDLFAGSGALGFEAASRGASTVTMVENNSRTYKNLEFNKNSLNAEMVKLVKSSASDYLRLSGEQFDLVFLDPPFHQGTLQDICNELVKGAHLRPEASIYLEYEKGTSINLPSGWEWYRQKTNSDVGYGLIHQARRNI